MKVLVTIAAVVVGLVLYYMDSKNREKDLEISELKTMVKYLEWRESSLEDSVKHHEEKAEKYENAYYSLYEDYEKLKGGNK